MSWLTVTLWADGHTPVETHRHTTMCDSNEGDPLIYVSERQV